MPLVDRGRREDQAVGPPPGESGRQQALPVPVEAADQHLDSAGAGLLGNGAVQGGRERMGHIFDQHSDGHHRPPSMKIT